MARVGRGASGASRLAIVVGVLLALVLGVAPHRAHADCLPPLINCPPPPPPPSPTAPGVTAASGGATGFTSANVSGTLDPGGAQTTYYWLASDHMNHAPSIRTKPITLTGDAPVEVNGQLTGLQPGTDYDLSLQATNDYGAGNHWTYNAFLTPQRATITVHTNPTRSVLIGNSTLQVWAHFTGEFSRYSPVELYIAPAPFHHWYLANKFGPPPGHYDNSRTPLCLSNDIFYNSCRWTAQNFKVRVQDGTAASRPLLEYVDPGLAVSSFRENNGYSPWLDVRMTADVHYIHHDFHSQRVYFYERPGRRGLYRLRAVGRFRVHGNFRSGLTFGSAELIATGRIRITTAAYTFACFRHPLLADMGRPFLLRWCGRPTLK